METNTTNADDLIYAQAAHALGMSTTLFSRTLRLKGFNGRRAGRRNAKMISRAEIDALFGVALTDEQVAAAKQVKAPITDKKLKARMAEQRRQAPRIDLDFGWIRFGWEMCADAFLKHLLARGIDHIEPPPFDPELATDMATRSLFTRAEVYALLDSSVKQRDRQWDEWIVDGIQRAQFPTGPAPLDFHYPEPLED